MVKNVPKEGLTVLREVQLYFQEYFFADQHTVVIADIALARSKGLLITPRFYRGSADARSA